MAKRICPKCNLGEMYATGGGYNYCCPLCGHTYHESRPRPHISRGLSPEMEDAADELNRLVAENKRMREQTKREMQEAKRNNKEKFPLKEVAFGIFMFWLCFKILSMLF